MVILRNLKAESLILETDVHFKILFKTLSLKGIFLSVFRGKFPIYALLNQTSAADRQRIRKMCDNVSVR